MIRLCSDTIWFGMMDMQLNVIKKYCTGCVTRGMFSLPLGRGLCDIAMNLYVHALVYKILAKVRYKNFF